MERRWFVWMQQLPWNAAFRRQQCDLIRCCRINASFRYNVDLISMAVPYMSPDSFRVFRVFRG